MTKKGRVVQIAEGLRGYSAYSADFALADHDQVKIKVGIVLVGGAYQVSELTLKSTGDEAVSTELLRQIPLRTILRSAIGNALRNENLGSLAYPPPGRARTSDGRLKNTAFVYRLARLTGEPPVQAVMEAEQVSRSTATRMVASARKAGYLGSDEAGQAGGAPSRARLEV